MTSLQGAPGWRLLAALATAVALAHVLVLQASPAQLGQSGSRSAASAAASKTFATRSIDAPAAPAAAQPEAVPAPPRAPEVAQAAPPAKKIKPNRPEAQYIRAQAAPDLIANTGVAPLTPAATPLPESTAAASSTPSFNPSSEATSDATSNTTSDATSNTTSTATLAQAAPTSTSTSTPTASPAPAAAALVEPASASLPAGPQTTPATAINLPGSARLQYKVTGLSKSLKYQATAELLWKASGDKYEAALKVSAFLVGSRSMTSVGQITAAGLAPTRFADKSKNELAAHFEAAKGKIVFSANTPDAPWVEGAQDRVSVFLQLGGILAAKPAEFSAGSSVTIYTAGPREAELWTFEVESQETLELLGAPMGTLKLIRKPRREFDQKVEVWYAPSLGYLPVRNRITQASGDFVDQQLSEIDRL